MNKTVLVVRTDHMNDDWSRANRYLEQNDSEIMMPDKKVRDSSEVERPVTSTS